MSKPLYGLEIGVVSETVARNITLAQSAVKAVLSARGTHEASVLGTACVSCAELGFTGANDAIREGLRKLRAQGEYTLHPPAQQIEEIGTKWLEEVPRIIEHPFALFCEGMKEWGFDPITDEGETRQRLTEFASAGANMAMIIWKMAIVLPHQ